VGEAQRLREILTSDDAEKWAMAFRKVVTTGRIDIASNITEPLKSKKNFQLVIDIFNLLESEFFPNSVSNTIRRGKAFYSIISWDHESSRKTIKGNLFHDADGSLNGVLLDALLKEGKALASASCELKQNIRNYSELVRYCDHKGFRLVHAGSSFSKNTWHYSLRVRNTPRTWKTMEGTGTTMEAARDSAASNYIP